MGLTITQQRRSLFSCTNVCFVYSTFIIGSFRRYNQQQIYSLETTVFDKHKNHISLHLMAYLKNCTGNAASSFYGTNKAYLGERRV